MKVFVSYRRADVGGHAGRLTDALTALLGAGNVFHDVTVIGPGRDFQVEIQRSLDDADVVLAVIGPGWLTATSPEGHRRLFEPNDFVRAELSQALGGGLTVVPVLVGGAAMPTEDDLPPDLAQLSRRQSVVVHDESFHPDVERLVRSLRGGATGRPGAAFLRRPVVAAAAALVLLAAAAAGIWGYLVHGRGSGTAHSPTGCPATSSADWTDIPVKRGELGSVPFEDGFLGFTVGSGRWRLEKPGTWLVVLRVAMENRTGSDASNESGKYRSVIVARRESDDPYCFDGPEGSQAPTLVTDASVGFFVSCRPVGAMSLRISFSDSGRKAFPFTSETTPAACLSS